MYDLEFLLFLLQLENEKKTVEEMAQRISDDLKTEIGVLKTNVEKLKTDFEVRDKHKLFATISVSITQFIRTNFCEQQSIVHNDFCKYCTNIRNNSVNIEVKPKIFFVVRQVVDESEQRGTEEATPIERYRVETFEEKSS